MSIATTADARQHSVPQSLWFTASRMQNLAVQPLDLLPPVDVTFADYAEAVLRAEQIVNPTDPDGYRGMMLKAFGKRGTPRCRARIKELKDEPAVLSPVEMRVFHEACDIAASRANAYRFLDDNRRQLLIPYGADLVVSDLSTAVKFTTRRRRQAKHVLLQYVWREDVPLVGSQFGQFNGQTTDLLCGATLALDIDGNLLAWARKPGTLPLMRSVTGGRQEGGSSEAEAGTVRRGAFLAALAARIQAGSVGGAPASGAMGLLQKSIAPLNSYVVDGTVRFGLAPHVGIRNQAEDEDRRNGRQVVVDKLLIRAYSVGVGDCIHVTIPKARTDGADFHILIDCGTRGKGAVLKLALDHLKTKLPEVDGKRRLDLLAGQSRA